MTSVHSIDCMRHSFSSPQVLTLHDGLRYVVLPVLVDDLHRGYHPPPAAIAGEAKVVEGFTRVLPGFDPLLVGPPFIAYDLPT